MNEILDNFIFALKKIRSAEEKRALDTANSFQKSYIEYFQHTSDKLKTQTTQWGMYAQQLNRQRLVCPNCGASLSLKNGCKCLYCDSELDLVNIDWVIDKYDILQKKDILSSC